MSLQWELPREVPADTAQVGQAVLRPGNVYREIGDRFNDLFPNETVFVPLYEPTGRGAISPLLLALVTVFQMLEKIPDRLAAELVVSRIDWKYALHLPLTYTGFHYCDLSYFRKRLLAHKQERLLFEELLKKLQALGLIKARGKMRTDSTHVLGLVEHLSRMELVCESVRVALRAVKGVAPEWVERSLPAAFCETYEARQSDYGLSEAEVQARLVQGGRDGFWFLEQLERTAPAPARLLEEVGVLRTVLEQQFPGGPSHPPSSKRPSGTGIIESPHEPEVRRAAKRGKGWVGYKVQVTESCDEGAPHLITDLEATEATANDSPELVHIQERLQAQETVPAEQYVDQGYMSGKGIADSRKRGIELVGRPLGDTAGPAGFRQRDFQIDEDAQQVVCAKGEISRVWSERASEEGEPPAVEVRFAAASCRACEFFGRCTNSGQGRMLQLHPYRQELQARRAEAGTEAYRQRLKTRNAVEGTISELVRGHDLRFARYRGQVKLRLQGLFAAVAVNLKRLARWWKQTASSTGGTKPKPVTAC